MPDYTSQLNELLSLAIQEQASDLHISVGHPPILRINSRLIPLKGDKISPEDSENLARALMNDERYQRFLSDRDIDFSYSFAGKARFRVNVFYQRGFVSVALRLINTKIKNIEELNLPPVFHKFAKATQGFILITGPSSQGKSTSLASLIDEINHSRAESKTRLSIFSKTTDLLLNKEKFIRTLCLFLGRSEPLFGRTRT
jgi:twitching motility protein PilT